MGGAANENDVTVATLLIYAWPHGGAFPREYG